MISNAIARAFDEVAARERDVLNAYVPGSLPEHDDAAKPAHESFTLNPLAAAPPENAYFVTRDEEGRMLFSRDGSFELRHGALVDSQGNAVLGYDGEGSALAPLRANAIDVAFGATASARIEIDGAVTYERSTIDPRSGNRETQRLAIGRVALARFAAATKLQPVDAQHFLAPPQIAAHFGRAADGNFGPVKPFVREDSRIDLDTGIERLQEAYIALEALRAASRARGGLQKTAMDLLK